MAPMYVVIMKKALILFPILLFLVVSCGGESGSGGGGSENSSAESAALAFFNHIYNTKNFNSALRLASPKLQRLMKSYHTPKGVSRHIINLRYDSKVNLEIDGGNSVGRTEFATKQSISVFLSGSYQGNIVDELRTVKLTRDGGDWVVDEILVDKFM